MAPCHSPWTLQPLLAAQFNTSQLIYRERLCKKSLKNNGHAKQKLSWENSPKFELAKKKLCWKNSPSTLLIHWKFILSVLQRHLSFPVLLSCSTTNTSYRTQREKSGAEVTPSMRTFPLVTAVAMHERFFLWYICSAYTSLGIKQLHFSCLALSVKNHAWAHTHTYAESKGPTLQPRFEVFPSAAQADALWDGTKSCTPRAGAVGLTCARLQAAAWLRFSELYCPLRKNSSIESEK